MTPTIQVPDHPVTQNLPLTITNSETITTAAPLHLRLWLPLSLLSSELKQKQLAAVSLKPLVTLTGCENWEAKSNPSSQDKIHMQIDLTLNELRASQPATLNVPLLVDTLSNVEMSFQELNEQRGRLMPTGELKTLTFSAAPAGTAATQKPVPTPKASLRALIDNPTALPRGKQVTLEWRIENAVSATLMGPLPNGQPIELNVKNDLTEGNIIVLAMGTQIYLLQATVNLDDEAGNIVVIRQVVLDVDSERKHAYLTVRPNEVLPYSKATAYWSAADVSRASLEITKDVKGQHRPPLLGDISNFSDDLSGSGQYKIDIETEAPEVSIHVGYSDLEDGNVQDHKVSAEANVNVLYWEAIIKEGAESDSDIFLISGDDAPLYEKYDPSAMAERIYIEDVIAFQYAEKGESGVLALCTNKKIRLYRVGVRDETGNEIKFIIDIEKPGNGLFREVVAYQGELAAITGFSQTGLMLQFYDLSGKPLHSLDLENDKKYIDVNGRTSEVAVNPITNKIYVASSGREAELDIDGQIRKVTVNDSIVVINGETDQIYTTIGEKLGGFEFNGISGVAVNPKNNKIYVTSPYIHSVQVINGGDDTIVGQVACEPPTIAAIDPIRNRVFVTSHDSNAVMVIDGESQEIIHEVQVVDIVSQIAVNPTTNKVYVTHREASLVTVINGENFEVKEIDVKDSVVSIAVNPVANKVYVTLLMSGSIKVIGSIDDQIIRDRELQLRELNVGGIAVNPLTDEVYVAHSEMSPQVTIIDGKTFNTIDVLSLSSAPENIAFNPVTNKLYLTTSYSDLMEVFDTSSQKLFVLGKKMLVKGINQVFCYTHEGSLVPEPVLHAELGKYWIGGEDRLFILDRSSGDFTSYRYDSNGRLQGKSLAAAVDEKGKLLLTSKTVPIVVDGLLVLLTEGEGDRPQDWIYNPQSDTWGHCGHGLNVDTNTKVAYRRGQSRRLWAIGGQPIGATGNDAVMHTLSFAEVSLFDDSYNVKRFFDEIEH